METIKERLGISIKKKADANPEEENNLRNSNDELRQEINTLEDQIISLREKIDKVKEQNRLKAVQQETTQIPTDWSTTAFK